MIKKIIKWIWTLALKIGITFGVIYLVIVILFMFDDGYTPGKDTYESFGNGRFQIISSNSEELYLIDLKDGKTIESDIRNYYKVDNKVYIIGIDGYCILNYAKEEYKQSKELKDFTEDEQKAFNDLEKYNSIIS